MVRKLIVLLLAVPLLFGFGKTAEDAFWQWFLKNQKTYFAFDPHNSADRERLFDRLSAQLDKVHPDLTFEFGPVVDGQREFVVSAGGLKDVAPAVERLVVAAPAMAKWKVTAFRPRRSPLMPVKVQGVELDPDQVWVQLYEDGERIGLRVLMEGYNDAARDAYVHAGFLMLDQALGESDVIKKVGFIDFEAPPERLPESSVRLRELPATFDNVWERLTAS